MEEKIIELKSDAYGMREMAEMMAPGTQVYRQKEAECDRLKAQVVALEAQLVLKEEEILKERSDKERWIKDSLLYRDVASQRGAMLQLIILNASRLKTVMSKITEIAYISLLRTVLHDSLDNPHDVEQQLLVDSTTEFPEPPSSVSPTQQIMNFNGPVGQQVAYTNEISNKNNIQIYDKRRDFGIDEGCECQSSAG